MKVLIWCVLVASLLTGGCTRDNETIDILEAQGYTHVVITGYDAWGCSDDDLFHTAFEATSPTGKTVRGVVCSDYFKGATVRFHR